VLVRVVLVRVMLVRVVRVLRVLLLLFRRRKVLVLVFRILSRCERRLRDPGGCYERDDPPVQVDAPAAKRGETRLMCSEGPRREQTARATKS
jgi:hypothetical protein